MTRVSLKDIGKNRIYNDVDFNKAHNVILWEVLKIKHEQEFDVKFIRTKSDCIQGIRLAIDVGEGYLEINGIKSKEMHLWENTAPKITHVKCVSEEGLLSVYNVFDEGPDGGGVYSQMYGSGMLLEEKNNKYIYKCNDFGIETKFDKLVFSIKLK